METKFTKELIGSHKDLPSRGSRFLYRLLEILPGVLIWSTFILAVVLSYFIPVWVALFIIGFDIYWMVRIVYLNFFLANSFRQMKRNMNIDWHKKIKKKIGYSHLHHLVILPIYKEPYQVIKESLISLSHVKYPKKKLMIVLAAERRTGKKKIREIRKLRDEFKGMFEEVLVTVHPANLPGEIPGKGSNDTWAAKKAVEKLVDPKKISHKNVLVTVFDADTQTYPHYFSRLTWLYLTTPHGHRASYQPIPLFHNNIWDAPAFARIISLSTTFWFMILQQKPERQGTFASHSMNLDSLVRTGYWQTNVVSEDSRIFYQCFLRFRGHYKVIPMYYPVSMDANVSHSFLGTARAQYVQQRRWASGVEHVPYLIYNFARNSHIALSKKIWMVFVAMSTFYSWATTSLLILLLGWLPIIIGGEAFNATLLSFNLPRLTSGIMTFSMIGLSTLAIITVNLVPSKPKVLPRRLNIYMVFQWIMMPFIMLLFGAVPGIDAQTRMMFNKKLGFIATHKIRK